MQWIKEEGESNRSENERMINDENYSENDGDDYGDESK